ncbi:hypothetical protein SKAU_G00428550 [Synaphobranchus kaupii]|uniref:Uncharacterized protein n=1 Tax=Synaphobranchus kaupii TaxID=118154 RepID=A0A9Q1I9E2_SYNKA|nr:hypothetical protein SKAU_G00428550 [Synaphobranchus kaupii]
MSSVCGGCTDFICCSCSVNYGIKGFTTFSSAPFFNYLNLLEWSENMTTSQSCQTHLTHRSALTLHLLTETKGWAGLVSMAVQSAPAPVHLDSQSSPTFFFLLSSL